jgi:hypothetical protein
MTEFYNKTYNYNQLEIDVVKRTECVIISCLDKQLHKSYQETFTQEIVFNMFGIGNLNNFIKIIEYVIDNNKIVILSEPEKLNFNIDYFDGNFIFKFNFLLLQVEQMQMNNIYIEKLEERIEELEKYNRNNDCIKKLEERIEKLEEYINELKRAIHIDAINDIPVPLIINKPIIDKPQRQRQRQQIFNQYTMQMEYIN